MHFLDAGGPPGVGVWTLVDGEGGGEGGGLAQLDPRFRRLVVVLNATPAEVLHPWGPGVRPDAGLRLHPVLRGVPTRCPPMNSYVPWLSPLCPPMNSGVTH